jgi:hypothetical protein
MITPAGSFNHEGGKHDILGWYWLIIAVTELMKHCEQTRNWETGHKGSIHTGKTLKNVTATISFCQVSKLSLSRKQKYRRNFNTREYWGGIYSLLQTHGAITNPIMFRGGCLITHEYAIDGQKDASLSGSGDPHLP